MRIKVSGPSFRCARCVGRELRCKACRARRREYRLAAAAAHLAGGRCRECPEPHAPGKRLCKWHLADAAARVAAYRARKRDGLAS